MATLFSRATGNFLTASTWRLVDSTSFLSSENATVAVTTSYQSSQGFIPGAITLEGIAVRLSFRSGSPTGTFSVELHDGTSSVAGTEVTINVADLPAAVTADLNGGWVFFKFASPVTLSGATHTVRAKTSSGTQVSLFTNGTNQNWSRCLVTSTTQAPVAGDDMIIAGEFLSAGSSNTITVTMDNTNNTDFGANNTSTPLVTPGIAIATKGVLTFGNTAATNYQLRLSGQLIVYLNGTLNLGTVASPTLRNTTAWLWFDCGANVDFGLTIRNGGTIIGQGLSRTSGKNIDRCFLNTDEAIAQTVLGVDTDTGWLTGDTIAIASTTRTLSQCEERILQSNAGATDLTVTVGLTNAHSGTSPTQAEVILLTRNVKISGASATLQAYIDIKAGAICDFDWVEFYWLGSNTTLKRGIDVGTTTGTCTFDYCSLRDFVVTGSRGINMTGTSGTGLAINYMVSNNVNSESFVNVLTSGSSVLNYFTGLKNVTGFMIILNDCGGTFTNITTVGDSGISTTDSGVWGTLSGFVTHSCAASGYQCGNGIQQQITGLKSYRNTGNGINISTSGTNQITIIDADLFGNTTQNLRILNGCLILINPVISGDSSFATVNGISSQGNVGSVSITIFNGSFSPVSGIRVSHTGQDLSFTSSSIVQIVAVNTIFNSSSGEIASQSSLPPMVTQGLFSQKHGGVSNANKAIKRFGTLSSDTGTVHGSTRSMKMTPISASQKLTSEGLYGGFKTPVLSGQSATLSARVYEDASYNGNRARLIVKANYAIGINADVVLDTATAASDAAWEELTGTTANASEDGVIEWYIDCDGTAGNLFIDSIAST